MIEIGVAKVDITAFEPGLGMMGWGFPENRATGVAMPLHARAFVLRDPEQNRRLALVVADMCFVPQGVRQAVLDALTKWHGHLGLDENTVMLSATHTHSGPGGTSHHVFYNTNSFGFSRPVFDKIVDGMVEAIVAADAARRPGRVRLSRGEFPVDQPVAFNRAIRAYNANPEVQPKIPGKRPPEAVDRTMVMLRFDDEQGQPIGSVNWFAVHCTSVHRDNTLLHPDNKGLAADMLETHVRRRQQAADYVAAFAQGACGDVSPNFRWHQGRGLMVGAVDDDVEAARLNASLQLDKARELLDGDKAQELSPNLDGALLHGDFSCMEVEPRFGGGKARHTAPAEIGFRMIIGTDEGPGLPLRLAPWFEAAARGVGALQRAGDRLNKVLGRGNGGHRQGNKIPFITTGKGRGGKLLGTYPLRWPFPLPAGTDPFVAHHKQVGARGGIGDLPWTPQVLPAQILIIGELALAAVPSEFTTVSGHRLRQSLLERLRERGVRDVVIAGYSNSYAGYVTTPEEYALQGYEASSTHFGPWTLGAHQTLFDRVARRLLVDPELRPQDLGAVTPRFDDDELSRRAYSLDTAPPMARS
ncbi:MAG: neutral/alkaline non-lysosomal ceramidase N-terminal domain-containing protein [Pseudomonadota bacterium]